MKIAFVATLYPPYIGGGAERSLQELARGLVTHGHSVTVVSLGPEALGMTTDSDHGVTVIRLASPAFRPFAHGGKNETLLAKLRWHSGELLRIGLGRRLTEILRSLNPDVVHTSNLAGFGWVGWRSAKRLDLPLVHTIRDYYLDCLNSTHRHKGHECGLRDPICRAAKLVFRFTPHRPDVYVGVSADILARHRRAGAVRRGDASAVVYNRPNITKLPRTGQAQRVFTFGAIGRIAEDKGTWIVIEAFKRLPPELRAKARLVLAGEGAPQDESLLQDLIRHEAGIVHLGPRPAPEFYAGIDCALVATQWAEPFGRTAAEALATGVPLIGSRAGAIPEVVALYGGEASLVEDYRDPIVWAAEMTKAATDGLPVEIATREQDFSPEELYQAVYRDLFPAQPAAT